MKFFYTGLNKFMWNHSFIKSCTHFASRFCPYIVAIFYILFLVKIILDRPNNLLILTAEPIAVFTVTTILRLVTNRKRPSEKYNLIPIDGSKKNRSLIPKYPCCDVYINCFSRTAVWTKYGTVIISARRFDNIYQTCFWCTLYQ